MKKMKIFTCALPLALILASLVSCNRGSNNEPDEPTLTGDKFCFHYFREDANYSSYALWLWADGKDGKEYVFNGEDSYGATATYYLSEWSENLTNINFIVKSKGSWNEKDPDGDRTFTFSDTTKDADDTYHCYLVSADSSIYFSESDAKDDKIQKAEFSSEQSVYVKTNNLFSNVKLYEGENKIYDETLANSLKEYTFTIDEFTVDYSKNYKVEVTFEGEKVKSKDLSISKLFSSEGFGNAYNYDGELGAIYSNSSTVFKVWSPLSSDVKVRIYENGTPTSVSKTLGNDECKEYEMTKGDKGVFSYTLEGDNEGKYYTYVVTNSKYENEEVVDPYAKSAGVNGLRGMIVDFSKTNPDGWNDVSLNEYDRKELTVYETHVADVTSSSTWTGTEANRKKFLGLAEGNTTYSEGSVTVKTGFDHIKELGVNAVQLIPIFDQANDEVNTSFNWGYNPLNYNVLEGSYSSNPYDGYTRIKEFKEVVKAYNEANINIIMDVVYNHVNSATKSNFDVLMPEYYFRYTDEGTLSNGSGCGNETASENYMMSKFIVDSTSFWASEYKLGGFRFDLMGLHDLDTMKNVAATLKEISTYISVYGEPWTGGTSTLSGNKSAIQANGKLYNGYGAFNDQMRDALIAGGLHAAVDGGFVTTSSKLANATMEKITEGIRGVTSTDSIAIDDPDKTVNYVTCHDNYTLYDRIKAYSNKHLDREITEDDIKKMATFANSIVFTSQGTTFMLAGDEFLRTKGGDSNSYSSGYEVNALDYSLKIKNLDSFKNYQKLINFKQSVDGLHLDKYGIVDYKVESFNDNTGIRFEVNDSANNKTYLVIHNKVASTLDLSGYKFYYSTLRDSVSISSSTSLLDYETLIVEK